MLPTRSVRYMSIKTKISLAVLAMVSVLLFSISGVLFFYFKSVLTDSILSNQYTQVREIAEQFNGRLRLAQTQLYLSAASINSTNINDPLTLNHILEENENQRFIFDSGFLIVGSDGIVRAESMGSPELVGQDMNARDYIRSGLQTGKSLLSEPFQLGTPPNNNTPMVAMVSPVRDDTDKVIGLFVGYHSLGGGNFLTSITTSGIEKSYLYILDGRTIVMHPVGSRVMEVIPEGKNRGIDQSVKGFEGSLVNVNSKGVHLISSFKRIGETRWTLVANQPSDIAFAPLKRLTYVAGILALTGIVLSISLVWFVTGRMTRPVELLTSHLEQSFHGNTDWVPLQLKTGDELESLAEAFNSLMVQVQDGKQLLQNERDFFSGIIQSTAAPMFVIDVNHTIIFWNDALARMTGLSSIEMQGTTQAWRAFYDQIRPVLADLIIDHATGRISELYGQHSSSSSSSSLLLGSFQAEGWFDDIGGKRRYLFFEAAPVFNSSGIIVAAVETLKDITERKLAQEALSSRNQFLQEILDAIPNPVFYKDTRGAYIGCNKMFLEFFGRREEKVIGSTLADLAPSEFASENADVDRVLLEIGGATTYETTLIRSDGGARTTLVSKALFSNADGTVGGIVGAFVDITEQRRADQQMRKMSRAMEQSPATIVITDLEGAIEYVNPKFCRITGYTRDEALGQNPRVLKSGEMPAEAYTVLWNTISSGREWRGEFHNKRKDGSLFWEYASISPLYDAYEKMTGYLAVKEDISERKLIEEQLAASRAEIEANLEELQQAHANLKEAQLQIYQQEKMASVGQLAAGVAHEINNPMGFITSNLGTLSKYVVRLSEYIGAADRTLEECSDNGAAGLLSETRVRLKIDHIMSDARQLIAECQDGAGRVRRIVSDLKNFSRVDQAYTERANLNELLETTINIAWSELKYVADVNREFGEIPAVTCYPQQLNQVFLNLLVNSAHAMEGKRGTITVRTWYDSDNIYVAVIDSGRGIPADIQRRIFEPFFTTKAVGKGTGLGLSISYDIIKKHGGEITLESEEGHGAAFTVRLPREAGAPDCRERGDAHETV